MRANALACLVVTGMFVVLGFAQTVVNPWDIPCNTEKVEPNLQVKIKQRIHGELKDESGAPLSESKVLLRRLRGEQFVDERTVSTDKDGRFYLGIVGPGKYRFLPAPHRGFKQPKAVDCNTGDDCEMNLVLHANPTDQPYAGCPIK